MESYLLKVDNLKFWKKIARDLGFNSLASFIRFALEFTNDCLLFPNDASTHAFAAKRFLKK